MQELKYRVETVAVDTVNRNVGIHETGDNLANLLTRMCLRSEVTDEGKSISVEVPPTRPGECVKRDCDILCYSETPGRDSLDCRPGCEIHYDYTFVHYCCYFSSQSQNVALIFHSFLFHFYCLFLF